MKLFSILSLASATLAAQITMKLTGPKVPMAFGRSPVRPHLPRSPVTNSTLIPSLPTPIRTHPILPNETDSRHPHCAPICDTFYKSCLASTCATANATSNGHFSPCYRTCVQRTCAEGAPEYACNVLCGFKGQYCGGPSPFLPFIQDPELIVFPAGETPVWPSEEGILASTTRATGIFSAASVDVKGSSGTSSSCSASTTNTLIPIITSRSAYTSPTATIVVVVTAGDKKEVKLKRQETNADIWTDEGPLFGDPATLTPQIDPMPEVTPAANKRQDTAIPTTTDEEIWTDEGPVFGNPATMTLQPTRAPQTIPTADERKIRRQETTTEEDIWTDEGPVFGDPATLMPQPTPGPEVTDVSWA